MKTHPTEIDRAAQPQTTTLHRKEHASAERRDMAAMFEDAKRSGVVETPKHVTENRRRKRELDLTALET